MKRKKTLASLVQQKNSDTSKTSMPSIHVWGGETDFTWQGQQALYNIHHHSTGKVIQHTHGHFLPESQEPQTTYPKIIQALNEMMNDNTILS